MCLAGALPWDWVVVIFQTIIRKLSFSLPYQEFGIQIGLALEITKPMEEGKKRPGLSQIQGRGGPDGFRDGWCWDALAGIHQVKVKVVGSMGG